MYPSPGRLVEASDATRADAKHAVSKLTAGGGTAMGWWLKQANELFRDEPPGIHHAILLTDGQNADETPAELDDALRGVRRQLPVRLPRRRRRLGRPTSSARSRRMLLGEIDVIREPEPMAADFQEVMERAMGRHVSDVSIRLWTPVGAEIGFVKQAYPEIDDLTDRRAVVSEREGDYPTGAWGDEVRDYHVSITVPAHKPGDEMLAGRLKLVIDGEVAAETMIKAIWSEDEHLTTKQERQGRGDRSCATSSPRSRDRSRRSARRRATPNARPRSSIRLQEIAETLKDEDKLNALAQVTETDPVTGKVIPKAHIDPADEIEWRTRSVKTNRTRKPDPLKSRKCRTHDRDVSGRSPVGDDRLLRRVRHAHVGDR